MVIPWNGRSIWLIWLNNSNGRANLCWPVIGFVSNHPALGKSLATNTFNVEWTNKIQASWTKPLEVEQHPEGLHQSCRPTFFEWLDEDSPPEGSVGGLPSPAREVKEAGGTEALLLSPPSEPLEAIRTGRVVALDRVTGVTHLVVLAPGFGLIVQARCLTLLLDKVSPPVSSGLLTLGLAIVEAVRIVPAVAIAVLRERRRCGQQQTSALIYLTQ